MTIIPIKEVIVAGIAVKLKSTKGMGITILIESPRIHSEKDKSTGLFHIS